MADPADAEFEDEVPAVLKFLGYPANIQPTSLKSVGAPHAWPPMLAALSWLVDLLRYGEAVGEAENEESSFDDVGERMFFDYLAKGYQLFLRGEDDLSALEEEIAFKFESKNSSLQHDISLLTAANEELSREHHALTDGPSPLEEARKQNEDLRSDQAKFEKHIADLYEHQRKVTSHLEAKRVEQAERHAELAVLQEEIGRHKETIAGQELTPCAARTARAHTRCRSLREACLELIAPRCAERTCSACNRRRSTSRPSSVCWPSRRTRS